MFNLFKKNQMPSSDEALPGRSEITSLRNEHFVNKMPIKPPFPDGYDSVVFGMGCFWGAERKFWPLPGVYTTAVGYAAGFTQNPTYEEVCSGRTGHNEVVLVIFNPKEITLEELLAVFWESHNPTQGMRQGNDSGTQYRSGIYVSDEKHQQLAMVSKGQYQSALKAAGIDAEITSEILVMAAFYYAEEYHQQYLAKNPNGYCGLGGCGVSF